jgi:hypothetical protein
MGGSGKTRLALELGARPHNNREETPRGTAQLDPPGDACLTAGAISTDRRCNARLLACSNRAVSQWSIEGLDHRFVPITRSRTGGRRVSRYDLRR